MYYGLCIFKHRLTLLTSELCSNYERYLINSGQYFRMLGGASAPSVGCAIAHIVVVSA
jgi:hypothetical protein